MDDNLVPWTLRRHWVEYSTRVKSLAFFPCGEKILVTLYDGSVAVYDLVGRVIAMRTKVDSVPIRTVCIASADRILVGNDKYTVYVLDSEDLAVVHSFKAHLDYIRCIRMHPSRPDIVFTTSDDQTVVMWRLTSGSVDGEWKKERYFMCQHYCMYVTVSPRDNGRYICVASLSRDCTVFDIDDRTNIPPLRLGHANMCSWCEFVDTGSHLWLITGDDNGNVRVWDGLQQFKRVCFLQSDIGEISHGLYLPDSEALVVCCSRTGALRILSLHKLNRTGRHPDTQVSERDHALVLGNYNFGNLGRLWYCIAQDNVLVLAGDYGILSLALEPTTTPATSASLRWHMLPCQPPPPLSPPPTPSPPARLCSACSSVCLRLVRTTPLSSQPTRAIRTLNLCLEELFYDNFHVDLDNRISPADFCSAVRRMNEPFALMSKAQSRRWKIESCLLGFSCLTCCLCLPILAAYRTRSERKLVELQGIVHEKVRVMLETLPETQPRRGVSWRIVCLVNKMEAPLLTGAVPYRTTVMLKAVEKEEEVRSSATRKSGDEPAAAEGSLEDVTDACWLCKRGMTADGTSVGEVMLDGVVDVPLRRHRNSLRREKARLGVGRRKWERLNALGDDIDGGRDVFKGEHHPRSKAAAAAAVASSSSRSRAVRHEESLENESVDITMALGDLELDEIDLDDDDSDRRRLL